MSKPQGSSRPSLSRLELDILNVVWDLGDCTSAQVITAFNRQRKLAPTTIRTVLASLRSKGYIKPIPTIGRGFLFRPTVAREQVARRSLRELLSSLFKGEPRQAIAWLLDDSDMTEADLEEIRGLIESRRKKGRSS